MFFYQATKRMFQLCNKGIAFNMMTSYVNFTADDVHYMDPGQTLAYCIKDLSRFVRIYHDYPLYEYFVCVYKARPMRQ
jgi:hypothetical protein